MSENGRLEEAIARLIAEGATGALEVRLEKKRWLFFFADGALVYTRSNLKSEQVEELRHKLGDLPTAELIRHQAVKRLRNVLRSEGVEHSFHPDSHPPQVTPVHAVEALLEALRLAYTEDELLQRIQPVVQAWPRVRGDIGGLGLPAPLDQYLQDMDGGRPGQDVLDFAPAPPGVVRAAVLTLWLLGEIEIGDEGDAGPQVVGISSGSSAGASSPVASSSASSAVASSPAASPSPASPSPASPSPASPSPASPSPASSSNAAPAVPSPAPRAAVPAADEDPFGTSNFDLAAIIDGALSGGPPAVTPAPMPPAPEPPDDQMTRAMPHPSSAPPPRGEHPLAARLDALKRRIEGSANHFEVLDIAWQAEPEAIRLAYTALARELHPDRFHDGPEALREQATALFDRIRQAWEVLSDPASRQEHIDVAVHGKKSAEDQAREQLEAYWAADDAFRKGLTLINNGRIQAAHAQFKLAAEAVPDELQFQCYYGYTTFVVNRGGNVARSEEGLARLRDALERNKTQERQLDSGWTLLGRALREKGEFDQARRALVHALRLNPANADAIRELRRLETGGSDDKAGGKGGKKGLFSGITGLFGRK